MSPYQEAQWANPSAAILPRFPDPCRSTAQDGLAVQRATQAESSGASWSTHLVVKSLAYFRGVLTRRNRDALQARECISQAADVAREKRWGIWRGRRFRVHR